MESACSKRQRRDVSADKMRLQTAVPSNEEQKGRRVRTLLVGENKFLVGQLKKLFAPVFDR